MKKLLILMVLLFSCYFSFAAESFFSSGTACLRYEAATGKLYIHVDHNYVAWTTHVSGPTLQTWAYIKDPSGPGYLGPFAATSCDPATRSCDYDISSLLNTIPIQNCTDIFIVSNASNVSVVPGATPSPLYDPTTPFSSNNMADGCHNCFFANTALMQACFCPDSDILPEVTCNANFNLRLNYNTEPFALVPYTVTIIPEVTNPGSTYLYEWGDGTTSTTPSKGYPAIPGSTVSVCLTETMLNGCICWSCVILQFPMLGPASSYPCDGNIGNGPVAKNSTIIPETSALNEITLFPNPAGEKAEISLALQQEAKVSIRVLDTRGSAVLDLGSQVMDKGSQKTYLNTKNLAPGIYHVEVKIGQDILMRKLSIVK